MSVTMSDSDLHDALLGTWRLGSFWRVARGCHRAS
jgi:hypothetical protein